MITPEQRQLRKKFIGSSDVAAVLNLDPYRNAYAVWAEKTGRLEDHEGNDATEAGNYLEGAVLDWAEKQLGTITRDMFLTDGFGVLCANLDGYCGSAATATNAVVEAKTTGICGPRDEAYGELTEGEGVELPDRVICQATQQMLVVGPFCKVAWVPVLIGGIGFRMYRVDRNDALADMILERCMEFWSQYVVKDTPPPDAPPSLEVLKRLRRQPNKVVPIAGQLIEDLIVFRAAAKQAIEDKDHVERRVLEALGDAEAGETKDGRRVEYMLTRRKGYSVEETSYRQLKVRKPARQLAGGVMAI